jgi:predicted ATPase
VLEAHCADEDTACAYVHCVQNELDANGALLLETASRTPVTDTAGADTCYDAWEKSRMGRLRLGEAPAERYPSLRYHRNLPMPHLLRLSLKHRPPQEGAPYPFSVPQIQTLPQLDVDVPVTFFVGENGSGKSTLLEGIAAAAELPVMGSSQIADDGTLTPARQLGEALRLVWTARSRKGFFLRAEDFFGRLKWFARDEARCVREKAEALAGVRADAPSQAPVAASHPDEHALRTFISMYDARSHGESFMDLFTERFRPGGLYLLDEPEAPLSPRRQIAFLDVLIRKAKAGAQFIIATHSPILLACPGARIHSFDRSPIAQVAYDTLEHVVVTRDFLNNPGQFIPR